MRKVFKKTEGFTLVELIVVIAILGILAGVGTVGYSGYIKKANMAADEQMAASVKQALELAQYSHINENFSGYVVLSKGAAPTYDGEGIEAALKTMFGEDLSSLQLKYDGWTVDSDLLDAALNGNPTAVTNSSYVKNNSVSELLGNVQTITTAASEVVGTKANNAGHLLTLLEGALGTGYLEKAASTGVINKDASGNYSLKDGTYTTDGGFKVTQELQNQLSNLMVFSVAEDMKQYQSDPMTMAGLMLSGYNDDDVSSYNTATVLAAQYAFYKSFAEDCNAEQSFSELNDKIVAAGKTGSATENVKNALSDFLTANRTEMEKYVTEQGPTTIMTNATAITEIMTGVGVVEGNYANESALSNGSLYTSGGVANDLGTYINMAGLAASGMDMSTVSGASGGMLISVGGGDVAVIASAE